MEYDVLFLIISKGTNAHVISIGDKYSIFPKRTISNKLMIKLNILRKVFILLVHKIFLSTKW